MLQARFVPQAWVNDEAMDVDPQGETTWDCTEEMARLKLSGRQVNYQQFQSVGGNEYLDLDDQLKNDANAPEWIRNWTGPFSIYVKEI